LSFDGPKACNFDFEDQIASRDSHRNGGDHATKERHVQTDLLRSRPDAIIDVNHALVKLA